jgi:hypothetical protein
MLVNQSLINVGTACSVRCESIVHAHTHRFCSKLRGLYMLRALKVIDTVRLSGGSCQLIDLETFFDDNTAPGRG